jgi:hypothetical protein
MSINIESIPLCLRVLRQWVCWRYDDRGGKPTKVPVTIGGYNASSTDPTDWYSFEEVCEVAHKFDGIGFVFTADDPLLGIDLDDCLDAGRIKPWAEEVIKDLDGTYAEVSPSGNGVKFWAKAINPLASGRKVQVEDGSIEIYDRGRFFTVTGNVWDDTEPSDKQAAIDAIAAKHFSDRPNRPGAKVDHANGSLINGSDKVERARKYLATIEPAIEGSGGDNATYRAACKLVLGFDLDTDTAFELLASEFNPRCVPPWDEKLLRRKVEQADKETSDRGYLLTDQHREEFPGIDISGLLRTGTNTSLVCRSIKSPIEQSALPEGVLRPAGTIGEIIDYTLRTSLYPQPELALAGALAIMATITGRKITDPLGTRTNLYVLGLAPSGSGKEQARKTNKSLLHLSGGASFIGPERIASHAGLVSTLAIRPCTLFQLDEIGRMMATLKNPSKSPYLYNISSVLMQLYGSSDTVWIGDAYGDPKKNPCIDQPHPVIYGTSVPESFWHSLTAENVTDGLLGRMLPIESTAGYVDPQTPDHSEVHPSPIVANYSGDAMDRFHGHMAAIAARRKFDDKQAAALWSRSAGKAGKLALIFAASRQPCCDHFTVEIDDVNLAISLSNYLTRLIQQRVFEHVAENETEDKSKRILRLLAKPMTKSEITRKTQWLKKYDRNEILDSLVESGLVTAVTKQPAVGAPVTYFIDARIEAIEVAAGIE